MVHALEVSTALTPLDLTFLLGLGWYRQDLLQQVYMFSTFSISGLFVTVRIDGDFSIKSQQFDM